MLATGSAAWCERTGRIMRGTHKRPVILHFTRPIALA